jgi:glyoxylate/hydroxypyruvate reductase
MSVLVAITGRDNTKLIAKLNELLPNETIEQWPQCKHPNKVKFVLAWNAPDDLWQQLPSLKAVSSFGAGVDSIKLSLLNKDIKVVRIVDEQLAEDMAEYVLSHVLAQKLRLQEYFIKQSQCDWKPKRAYKYKHVGILGFGELGKACADKLILNGFTVSAWSKSAKTSRQVKLYSQQQGLDEMLPQIDYLVCLLPLTDSTKGIINADLLAKLPPHAGVINVARGAHIIEQDLLHALESGTLRAATVDVFTQEPLPNTHPFWQCSKLTITPHCAALSDLNSVTEQIADNINRLNNGLELNNRVNRTKGY